jgi:alkylated DNA repair protein (DNA oxidative demethylase)
MMPNDPTFERASTSAPRATADKSADQWAETLGAGATVLRGFAHEHVAMLVTDLARIAAAAPFRHMITPGGFRMSVAMTNCGRVGWITDRSGYRYVPLDPLTGIPWPAIPEPLRDLGIEAASAGGFADFEPDACLINRYEPGARMSLHQDRDERDLSAPVVSISLGLPAAFLFGGERRNVRPRRVPLASGDVVVWGGPSRLAYHGVAPLADGSDPITGRYRFNLTLRRAL